MKKSEKYSAVKPLGEEAVAGELAVASGQLGGTAGEIVAAGQSFEHIGQLAADVAAVAVAREQTVEPASSAAGEEHGMGPVLVSGKQREVARRGATSLGDTALEAQRSESCPIGEPS